MRELPCQNLSSVGLCLGMQKRCIVGYYFDERQKACIMLVDEYPTMHCFGIPRHTQPMIAYQILTELFK